VEDVHFDGGHGVEGALDDADGLEVARAVDHEAAPAEAGRILNGNDGQEEALAVRLNQLQQRFEAAHGTDIGGCVQMSALCGDFEGVGLVFVDALDGFAGAVDGDGQFRSTAGGNAGLHSEALESPCDSSIEPVVMKLVGADGKSLRDDETPVAYGELRGLGHERVYKFRGRISWLRECGSREHRSGHKSQRHCLHPSVHVRNPSLCFPRFRLRN
jgi:hypothetical protein